MPEDEKPNWGNRVILSIFIVLAIVTIAGTVIATMGEWETIDSGGLETTLERATSE